MGPVAIKLNGTTTNAGEDATRGGCAAAPPARSGDDKTTNTRKTLRTLIPKPTNVSHPTVGKANRYSSLIPQNKASGLFVLEYPKHRHQRATFEYASARNLDYGT
jgi:hypothetical protein